MRYFQPRWIVGKTVARVEMNPSPAGEGYGRGAVVYDPVIYFTDGSSIAFLTQECDDLSYGTAIIYRRHD